MWKLKTVGNSILEQYASEMLPTLRNRIVKGRTVKGIPVSLDPREISILIPNYDTDAEDTSILKDLLILEPLQLEKKCNSLMLAITKGKYQLDDLSLYLQIKKRKKQVLTKDEQAIVDRYEILEKLRSLFDYDGQISKNKERSYWLSQVKDAAVCTYCNRQYTFTVTKPDEDTDEYIARPELDHWFSKEAYPLMSLSFYNLIPSCHVCNSSAKCNILFNLKDYVHPYVQHEDNPKISFRPIINPDASGSYGVVIDRQKPSREDKTIDAFALDSIYDLHGALEVADLMNFNSAYTNSYLHILFQDILCQKFKQFTKAEVYRMLFGTELDPADFGKRPLSKLKYDILKFLDVI